MQVCFEQFRQSDRLKQNGFQKAVTQPGIPLSYLEARVCVYCCRFAVQIYVKNNIFFVFLVGVFFFLQFAQISESCNLFAAGLARLFFLVHSKICSQIVFSGKAQKCEKQVNGSTDYLQLVCLHLVWQ